MWIQVVIIIRNQAIKMISTSSNEGHGSLEKENASYQWCLIGFFTFPGIWNTASALHLHIVEFPRQQTKWFHFFFFSWVAETDRFQKEIRCCPKTEIYIIIWKTQQRCSRCEWIQREVWGVKEMNFRSGKICSIINYAHGQCALQSSYI